MSGDGNDEAEVQPVDLGGPEDTPERRIERALAFADRFGTIDGNHHKMWVIDQMVRALFGCPVELKNGIDARQAPYEYKAQGRER